MGAHSLGYIADSVRAAGQAAGSRVDAEKGARGFPILLSFFKYEVHTSKVRRDEGLRWSRRVLTIKKPGAVKRKKSR